MHIKLLCLVVVVLPNVNPSPPAQPRLVYSFFLPKPFRHLSKYTPLFRSPLSIKCQMSPSFAFVVGALLGSLFSLWSGPDRQVPLGSLLAQHPRQGRRRRRAGEPTPRPTPGRGRGRRTGGPRRRRVRCGDGRLRHKPALRPWRYRQGQLHFRGRFGGGQTDRKRWEETVGCGRGAARRGELTLPLPLSRVLSALFHISRARGWVSFSEGKRRLRMGPPSHTIDRENATFGGGGGAVVGCVALRFRDSTKMEVWRCRNDKSPSCENKSSSPR